jgi:alpha-maltose-1-phosphate synthase
MLPMRILYIASGIPVPGALGGSTHTLEVARGLAERGHELHVVACSAETAFDLRHLIQPTTTCFQQFQLHYLNVPKALSLLALPTILRLARRLRPDVIMERYYNFAGCGVIAARQLGIPCLLEVNALIIDPPAVRKRRIDDALGGPLRRWAITQCQWADRIVTPLDATVPAAIDRSKIVELPWGAAVDRFTTSDRQRGHVTRPKVVFLGSFRAWHGVLEFVQAAGKLLDAGCDAEFVLVGDGPQRQEAERLAARWLGSIRFTGSVHYDEVPALLAQATIGVAPFTTARHPALQAAGFFWSPLKVFEYMAAGLPVVTANIAPLNTVIRDGIEGMLFPEGNMEGLAVAIKHLLDDPQAAQAMGAAGRQKVVANYSWARHCEALERELNGLLITTSIP